MPVRAHGVMVSAAAVAGLLLTSLVLPAEAAGSVTAFTIDLPEDLGPGEVGAITVSTTVTEPIEEPVAIAFSLPDRALALLDAPDNCVVDHVLYWTRCVLPGLPSGVTNHVFSVAGRSVGYTDYYLVHATLQFEPADGDPQLGEAWDDMSVLDGELNGQQSDLDENGTADVVAQDGRDRLLLYRGDGQGGFGSNSVVGTGFRGQIVLPGDTGDLSGHMIDDVLYQTASGALLLYRMSDTTGRLSRGVVVLTGLSGWTLSGPGDWDGDGLADLVGRRAAGRLYLFAGDGAGHFGGPTLIGTGWNAFNLLVTPGDFDGDGHVDLVGRDPANALYLYPGSGDGGFGTPELIGTRWSFRSISGVGDFDGDLKADLVAGTAAGGMYLYPGTGAGGFGTATKIGHGWGSLRVVG